MSSFDDDERSPFHTSNLLNSPLNPLASPTLTETLLRSDFSPNPFATLTQPTETLFSSPPITFTNEPVFNTPPFLTDPVPQIEITTLPLQAPVTNTYPLNSNSYPPIPPTVDHLHCHSNLSFSNNTNESSSTQNQANSIPHSTHYQSKPFILPLTSLTPRSSLRSSASVPSLTQLTSNRKRGPALRQDKNLPESIKKRNRLARKAELARESRRKKKQHLENVEREARRLSYLLLKKEALRGLNLENANQNNDLIRLSLDQQNSELDYLFERLCAHLQPGYQERMALHVVAHLDHPNVKTIAQRLSHSLNLSDEQILAIRNLEDALRVCQKEAEELLLEVKRTKEDCQRQLIENQRFGSRLVEAGFQSSSKMNLLTQFLNNHPDIINQIESFLPAELKSKPELLIENQFNTTVSQNNSPNSDDDSDHSNYS